MRATCLAYLALLDLVTLYLLLCLIKHRAMKTYGERRCSSTIPDLGTRWRVCGQLDAIAALATEKRLNKFW
jgi:hypothetical protein